MQTERRRANKATNQRLPVSQPDKKTTKATKGNNLYVRIGSSIPVGNKRNRVNRRASAGRRHTTDGEIDIEIYFYW